MVDHFLLLTALRNRLNDLVVAETGIGAFAADGQGYTRSSGSFVADGFTRGMEVYPEGFVSNTEPGIITQVEALKLWIAGGTVNEPLVNNSRLVVPLPERRAWENMPFSPEDGRWYIEEDYLPGPSARATLGKSGFEMDVEPTYVLRVYGLSGQGVHALYKMADAILRLFAPNLAMPVADGHILRVRSDPAPERGQVLPEGASHALIVITVPLWVRVQAANIT